MQRFAAPPVQPMSLEPGSAQLLHDPAVPLSASITSQGTICLTPADRPNGEAAAWVPALMPESLGSAVFRELHHVRYAYVAGAMAGGISGTDLVSACSAAGILACLGTGGLDLAEIDSRVLELKRRLSADAAYEVNLLYNPLLPDEELRTVRRLVELGVRRVSASGYAVVTPALTYFRAKGVLPDADGQPVPRNFVSAKVSRLEVAREFLRPCRPAHLNELVNLGLLTPQESDLAARLPMTEDIIAEADSGGHTDRQPLLSLLSSFQDLRSEISRQHSYASNIRIGAAGGISTPISVAAAFIAGADFVLTGSINQSCVEADTSPLVKEMLAGADVSSVDMAPAGDLFEMGTQVQVLKHGTLYAARARKLFELYRQFDGWDSLPEKDQAQLEKTYFRMPVEHVWSEVKQFFAARDPRQVERADSNPRHKMALIFRWYLGLSSRWAREGLKDRKSDFQIWCGPAMGTFNRWVRGSFLESPDSRRVAVIAKNLMHGAAIVLRARWLALQGLPLTEEAWQVPPRQF